MMADTMSQRELQFLRALDKYDRLGPDGVRQLLTIGRRDPSGDFTPGCGLSEAQADCVLTFLASRGATNEETLFKMRRWFAIMTMPTDQLDKLHDALATLGLIEQ